MKNEKINSINEALSVLDHALQEGSEEIKNIIVADYQNLKEVLSGSAPTIFTTLKGIKNKSVDALNQTKNSMVDFSNKTAGNIDRNAHERPWTFIAGVTLSSLALGYYIGKKLKE